MDSIEKDLIKVDLGEIPSPFGELKFDLDLEPISQSAKSKSKKALKAKVADVCKKYQFLLSGDIQVEIQWLVNHRYRYEYHKAPDIDNIIKPLLDSLCGKSGIIIDDTQVQYIGSYWLDWTKEQHKLSITIKFTPDDFVYKENLAFVEFAKGLCLPFDKSLPPEPLLILLNAWKSMLLQRNEFEEQGMSYHSASLIQPSQRFFHRNKISDYDICKIDELITQLSS